MTDTVQANLHRWNLYIYVSFLEKARVWSRVWGFPEKSYGIDKIVNLHNIENVKWIFKKAVAVKKLNYSC